LLSVGCLATLDGLTVRPAGDGAGPIADERQHLHDSTSVLGNLTDGRCKVAARDRPGSAAAPPSPSGTLAGARTARRGELDVTEALPPIPEGSRVAAAPQRAMLASIPAWWASRARAAGLSGEWLDWRRALAPMPDGIAELSPLRDVQDASAQALSDAYV